jgi:hypothetical protein
LVCRAATSLTFPKSNSKATQINCVLFSRAAKIFTFANKWNSKSKSTQINDSLFCCAAENIHRQSDDKLKHTMLKGD